MHAQYNIIDIYNKIVDKNWYGNMSIDAIRLDRDTARIELQICRLMWQLIHGAEGCH